MGCVEFTSSRHKLNHTQSSHSGIQRLHRIFTKHAFEVQQVRVQIDIDIFDYKVSLDISIRSLGYHANCSFLAYFMGQFGCLSSFAMCSYCFIQTALRY